jgi:hypothetical protein
LKKPTSSVQFWFFKPGIGKTKPNRTEQKKTRKKLSQTEKIKSNQKKPSQTGFYSKKSNQTETGRFKPILIRFFKKI